MLTRAEMERAHRDGFSVVHRGSAYIAPGNGQVGHLPSEVALAGGDPGRLAEARTNIMTKIEELQALLAEVPAPPHDPGPGAAAAAAAAVRSADPPHERLEDAAAHADLQIRPAAEAEAARPPGNISSEGAQADASKSAQDVPSGSDTSSDGPTPGRAIGRATKK